LSSVTLLALQEGAPTLTPSPKARYGQRRVA